MQFQLYIIIWDTVDYILFVLDVRLASSVSGRCSELNVDLCCKIYYEVQYVFWYMQLRLE